MAMVQRRRYADHRRSKCVTKDHEVVERGPYVGGGTHDLDD